MKFTRFSRSGYTLIELMIALTISLFLLLGVTRLFQDVGSSITDTQKTLNMAANLNNVGIQLRGDLDGMQNCLGQDVNRPSRMDSATYTESGGYLEIAEGMNTPAVNRSGTQIPTNGRHALSRDVFVDTSVTPNEIDRTVGDVDDIIMFTAKSTDKSYPFRGLVNTNIQESTLAEIAWFVRGKTLYRRVLLVDDGSLRNANLSASDFYEENDLSVYRKDSRLTLNTLETLKRRENRFGHGTGGGFPYPIYYYNSSNNREPWYYLRLPTMEETVHKKNDGNNSDAGWPIAEALPGTNDANFSIQTSTPNTFPSGLPALYSDHWEQPYAWYNLATPNSWGDEFYVNWTGIDSTTGSIGGVRSDGTAYGYVENPRNRRAGEDIVLSNVLSFDVKVWNPYWVPCILESAADPNPGGTNNQTNQAWMWAPPQYIDLGQDRFVLRDDIGDLRDCKVNYQQNLNLVPAAIPSGEVGYGFTLKGRYNASRANNTRRTVSNNVNETEKWHKAERLAIGPNNENQLWNGTPMPCVYDTWTIEYENVPGYPRDTEMGTDSKHNDFYAEVTPPNSLDFAYWRCPPPYNEPLGAIQVTIRCYDPDSGNIRQLRIVHRVPAN